MNGGTATKIAVGCARQPGVPCNLRQFFQHVNLSRTSGYIPPALDELTKYDMRNIIRDVRAGNVQYSVNYRNFHVDHARS